MTAKFTIKKRQIEMLKKEIEKTYLIPSEIINDAEKLYNNNPYHNFLHALVVTSYVLKLNMNRFSVLELRSLAIAAIFHDTGHT
ncbi:MAG: HD domain-containing protein [Candidatus Peribacteria bacterium]|jgi:HD superfamily phosphodiesterase|nr:HD domain-containing protein [Candidatus Peribacteria bacterium]